MHTYIHKKIWLQAHAFQCVLMFENIVNIYCWLIFNFCLIGWGKSALSRNYVHYSFTSVNYVHLYVCVFV